MHRGITRCARPTLTPRGAGEGATLGPSMTRCGSWSRKPARCRINELVEPCAHSTAGAGSTAEAGKYRRSVQCRKRGSLRNGAEAMAARCSVPVGDASRRRLRRGRAAVRRCIMRQDRQQDKEAEVKSDGATSKQPGRAPRRSVCALSPPSMGIPVPVFGLRQHRAGLVAADPVDGCGVMRNALMAYASAYCRRPSASVHGPPQYLACLVAIDGRTWKICECISCTADAGQSAKVLVQMR
jgi:hypothetical protein